MSVTAFIQARVGSTRLPGKVLMDLEGKPVLLRVIERVKRARGIDEAIVVTTLGAKDLPLVRLCADQGVRVFCGSENDVLDRFYQAARIIGPEHVVRITADCPVMDPAIIEEVVHSHLVAKSDYTANIITERFPDGEDVEVMTFDALSRAWHDAKLMSEREHVTLYIRNHPELFRCFSVVGTQDHSSQRWTLDTESDYAFLQSLYRELGSKGEYFGMSEILDLLESKPELLVLNSGIQRNEGLVKSLREDCDIGEAN